MDSADETEYGRGALRTTSLLHTQPFHKWPRCRGCCMDCDCCFFTDKEKEQKSQLERQARHRIEKALNNFSHSIRSCDEILTGVDEYVKRMGFTDYLSVASVFFFAFFNAAMIIYAWVTRPPRNSSIDYNLSSLIVFNGEALVICVFLFYLFIYEPIVFYFSYSAYPLGERDAEAGSHLQEWTEWFTSMGGFSSLKFLRFIQVSSWKHHLTNLEKRSSRATGNIRTYGCCGRLIARFIIRPIVYLIGILVVAFLLSLGCVYFATESPANWTITNWFLMLSFINQVTALHNPQPYEKDAIFRLVFGGADAKLQSREVANMDNLLNIIISRLYHKHGLRGVLIFCTADANVIQQWLIIDREAKSSTHPHPHAHDATTSHAAVATSLSSSSPHVSPATSSEPHHLSVPSPLIHEHHAKRDSAEAKVESNQPISRPSTELAVLVAESVTANVATDGVGDALMVSFLVTLHFCSVYAFGLIMQLCLQPRSNEES